jgi:hypothetical protein
MKSLLPCAILFLVAASTLGLTGCASQTADGSTQGADLSAASSGLGRHDVFVCKGDKLVDSGTFMFAHDAKGHITNGTKAGYCELTIDAHGNAYGQYWCWVDDTTTAKTSDGQLALLFKKPIGDGANIYTQVNLPSDLLSAKKGSGMIRTLSRAPADLTTPIASGSESSDLDCSEQSVDFKNPES